MDFRVIVLQSLFSLQTSFYHISFISQFIRRLPQAVTLLPFCTELLIFYCILFPPVLSLHIIFPPYLPISPCILVYLRRYLTLLILPTREFRFGCQAGPRAIPQPLHGQDTYLDTGDADSAPRQICVPLRMVGDVLFAPLALMSVFHSPTLNVIGPC